MNKKIIDTLSAIFERLKIAERENRDEVVFENEDFIIYKINNIYRAVINNFIYIEYDNSDFWISNVCDDKRWRLDINQAASVEQYLIKEIKLNEWTYYHYDKKKYDEVASFDSKYDEFMILNPIVRTFPDMMLNPTVHTTLNIQNNTSKTNLFRQLKDLSEWIQAFDTTNTTYHYISVITFPWDMGEIKIQYFTNINILELDAEFNGKKISKKYRGTKNDFGVGYDNGTNYPYFGVGLTQVIFEDLVKLMLCYERKR